MRALALILILVNLGLLAWQYWLAPTPELTPPLSASLPDLVLVAELAPTESSRSDPTPEGTDESVVSGDATAAAAPAPDSDTDQMTGPMSEPGTDQPAIDDETGELIDGAAATGAAVDVEPEPPQMSCRSVGPFTSQVESRRAAALLAETGRVPLQRVTEGEVWLGHWVYLAAFGSAQEADEVAQALERALVEDFYIIRDGELANAISLGVYSQREGAEARLAEMRERGFPAEMTDRYRSAPVYWLDFAEPVDDPLSLSLLMPAAPGRVLRAETGDCALP
jgi:hypothetical protein